MALTTKADSTKGLKMARASSNGLINLAIRAISTRTRFRATEPTTGLTTVHM